MKTLSIKEFMDWEAVQNTDRLVTVKPSIYWGIFAVSVYLAFLIFMSYMVMFDLLPLTFMSIFSILIIAVLFILQLISFFKNLGPFSWVMLVYSDFLAIKPRSILNCNKNMAFDKDVLLLNSRDVIALRPKSGVRKTTGANGRTVHEDYKQLEIEVVDTINEKVASFFRTEATNVLKARSKVHHYPAVFSHGHIRINWFGARYAYSPCITKVLNKVKGSYSIDDPVSKSKYFGDSLEDLKEYLQGGSFVDAVRLVRRQRGCGLVEAVKVVRLAMSQG